MHVQLHFLVLQSVTYDTVYIGTGPVSIIDALHAASKGQTVLMIDNKEQVGGAWVAIKVRDYGRLEIGCHIWSYNKDAYRFIRDFFDLNLVELKPQPYFLKGDMKLSYDQKNIIITLQWVIKFLSRFQFSKLRTFIKENPSARIPIISKPYLYPKGGAREFQQALVRKLETSEVNLKLSAQITGISKENDLWKLELANNESIEAKRVVMTSTSSITSVKTSETAIDITHRKLNYTHFHLVIRGEHVKPFSYVRVLRHDLIHRVSDVTGQLDKNEKGYLVILVGVFDEKLTEDKPEDQIIGELKRYLITKKYISPNSEVVYAQKNKFETTYIPDDKIEVINALGDSLELVASTDLIYGIKRRMSNWPKV